MIAITEKKYFVARELLTIALSNAFLVVMGLLSFTLPFTCIPITFQVTAALFIGAFYGPRVAFFSVFALLAEGAMGFPVFASGASGLIVLIGPSAGYLYGYLVGSVLTGTLAKMWKGKLGAFFAICAGNLVVYLAGFTWLYAFTGNLKATFFAGIAPFIVQDLCKNALFTQIKLPRFLRPSA